MLFKLLLIIPFTLLFSFEMMAAPFCSFPFKKRPKSLIKEEMNSLRRLNRTDNLVNFIKKYKVKNSGSYSYLEKIKIRNNIIDTKVVSWDVDYAIRKWRPLFRKVEGSALYIEKYQKVLDALSDLGDKSLTRTYLKSKGMSETLITEVLDNEKLLGLDKYIDALKNNIDKEARRLGSKFFEYRYVKTHLEGLEKLNCNPDCIAQLEKLKKEIGITSQYERNFYRELTNGRENISFSEIEKVFNEHIHAFTHAQKIELFHEMSSFFGGYIKEVDLFWKVMKKLSDKTWVKERRLARLFKAIYDERAKIVNDPLINQISRVHKESASTVSQMKSTIRDMKAGEDMLVDFARRTDPLPTRAWSEAKEFAKANDPEFYKKMIKAEEIARFIGGMGAAIPRGIYYAFGAAGVGAGFITYFNFKKHPTPTPPNVEPNDPVTPPPKESLPLYPPEDDDEEIVDIILNNDNYDEFLNVMEDSSEFFEGLEKN